MRQKVRGAKVEAANGPERGRKKWLAREEENKDGEGGKRRGSKLAGWHSQSNSFFLLLLLRPKPAKEKGKGGGLVVDCTYCNALGRRGWSSLQLTPQAKKKFFCWTADRRTCAG